MSDIDEIDRYIETHLDENISELSDFCAQPSVSATMEGVPECAELLKDMLLKRGFTARVNQTATAPIVTAERKGRSDKTLLFYNHYDVQPAEPLELWKSPPFEPALRDGKLYGRGVYDDKGHITSRLFAIDALLSADGELPCNIKFIAEGEEETSSESLRPFVESHLEELAADACIWECGGVDYRDIPTQNLGLRGICYVELSVTTANQDIHSGLGGSIFPNAAWRLVWALASLKDDHENVLIPGFYDAVRPISKEVRRLVEKQPDPAEDYRSRYGLEKFLNGIEGGVDLNLAEAYQPSCTICGLNSGYQGAGSKTVLPAQASAKIDFRLAPDQDPEDIYKKIRKHLNAQGFTDIQVEMLGGEKPFMTDPADPFVKMVVNEAKGVYGVPQDVVPMIGGSGPSAMVADLLKLPIVSCGVGYPGGQAHAPNENLRLDLYVKGTKHQARIIQALGNA
jgi:acetylornithine deacetylase/succinyl-diaminopimelate desuccinylase-like protein